MPSEVDINLIFLRLEKLEERIKVLEADVKPDDYYQVKAGPAVVQRYPSEEEWRDNLKIISGPPGHGASYVGVLEHLSDNEKFEDLK